MKKVLSLVLALMMVVSMTTVAFATTFEDIDAENEALTKAASLLNALNVVTGYEDGSFKPEKVVTRAEMAAMLIRAKGYASIANDTPSFTDSQTHWAKGYIALASDLGIINGRGNGIFDPDSTVTYEEAAIMMLRALGYTDESINNGKSTAFNAANYRTKALSLNLFKDFTLTAMKDGATRGDIALMLTRNLNNNTVYTNEDGRAVVEKDENDDAVKLLNLTAKKDTFTVDLDDVEDALIDISGYLYQEVVAYLKDDAVVFVEEVNSTVKEGTVKTTGTTSVTLKGVTDPYTVNSTTEAVFYNNDEVTFATAQTALVGATVKLVLDDNDKVVGIIANEETNSRFITSVYKTNSTVLNGVALPVDDAEVDLDNIVVTGAVDSLEDIELNDVVKFYASLDNSFVKLLVVRDSVEGKVTKASNDHSSVYINTLGEYRDADKALALEVLDEGTFYFDEDGAVYNFVEESSASPDYAIITKATNGVYVGSTIITNPVIKVLNADGEKVTYTIAEDAVYDVVDFDGTTDSSDNDVYDQDGVNTLELNIAVGDIVKSVTIEDEEVTELVIQNVKVAGANIDVDSKTFDPASDVVIFNYVAGTTPSFDVNTLEELVALETVNKNEFNYVINEDGEYSLILIVDSLIIEPDTKHGIIAEQQKVVNDDEDTVHELVTYINGEKITYLSDDDLGKTTVSAGPTLVNFTIEGGVVTNVSEVTTTAAITVGNTTSPIKNVTSTTFVNGSTKYFMNDDAAIYVFDGDGEFVRLGSLSDLESLNITINIYETTIGSRLVNNIVIITE